jgi:histone H3/H4
MSDEKKVSLVVNSKVKKLVADKHGLRCSAEVMDTLTKKVEEILESAATKAKDSKRKTIKSVDLD